MLVLENGKRLPTFLFQIQSCVTSSHENHHFTLCIVAPCRLQDPAANANPVVEDVWEEVGYRDPTLVDEGGNRCSAERVCMLSVFVSKLCRTGVRMTSLSWTRCPMTC